MIVIFPDTNMLIHGVDFGQVPWREVGNSDTVEICICRAVREEIDIHKNGPSGRKQSKCKTWNSKFFEAIKSKTNIIEIKSKNPRVYARLEDPSEYEFEDIDLSRDKRLVASAIRYRDANKDKDVYLISNDGGVCDWALYKGMQIFIAEGDSWILPPERSKIEKENTELRKMMDSRFPVISAQIFDPNSLDNIDQISIKAIRFKPLSNQDLERIVDKLKSLNPISNPKAKSGIPRGEGLTIHLEDLVRPTQENIDKYNLDYNEWINNCKSQILNYSKRLVGKSWSRCVAVCISNNGQIPANSVKCEIISDGDLMVAGLECDITEFESYSDPYVVPSRELPVPPKVPSGVGLRGLSNRSFGSNFFNGFFSKSVDESPLKPLERNLYRFPERSNYYMAPFPPYLSGNEGRSEKIIEYNCGKISHGREPVRLYFMVRVPYKMSSDVNLVKIKIHSDDSPKPFEFNFKVAIEYIEGDTMLECEKLFSKIEDR